MNLLSEQEAIKNYIKTAYKNVLAELSLPDVNEYVSDFVDLNTYKKTITLFYDFNKYSYDSLSNESETQNITAHIYIFFRSTNSKDLHTKMLKYASCFYEMVKRDQSLGRTVDFARVSDVQLYEACEANPNIKAVDITLEIKTEID